MAPTLTISDEVHQQLRMLADAQGQTLESLIAGLIEQAKQGKFRSSGHISYSDEEWMRHLGMSEDDMSGYRHSQ
jgi:hypothetical protein